MADETMSLFDVLPPRGDELCIHAGGRDHSRSAVRDLADDIACALVDAGVEPGAAVAVLLPNGAEVVGTLFGVWRAGAVYVPLNPLPDRGCCCLAAPRASPTSSSALALTAGSSTTSAVLTQPSADCSPPTRNPPAAPSCTSREPATRDC